MTGRESKGGETTNRSIAFSLLRAFFIGAGMALAWGGVSWLLRLDRVFPDAASKQMFSMPLPVQAALYGLAGPLLEELVFRLFLFDLVKRIVPEKWAAIIVSALFAVWHGNVIQMLYAFPAGLILQKMRRISGRIQEPVACHVGANLTAIAVERLLG